MIEQIAKSYAFDRPRFMGGGQGEAAEVRVFLERNPETLPVLKRIGGCIRRLTPPSHAAIRSYLFPVDDGERVMILPIRCLRTGDRWCQLDRWFEYYQLDCGGKIVLGL